MLGSTQYCTDIKTGDWNDVIFVKNGTVLTVTQITLGISNLWIWISGDQTVDVEPNVEWISNKIREWIITETPIYTG